MNTKKILVGLIFFIVFVTGVYVYVKARFHVDEKAIITALKPPSGDIAKELPQGSDLDTPLTKPSGFRLAVFADLRDVGAPRVLAHDLNGVLLASIPSKGKVVALPDNDKNGISDRVVEVASNLNRPHGIDFEGDKIFIAETDKVVSYDYDRVSFKAANPKKLFDLPGGGNHVTRTIKIYKDKLYTAVGSSCDVCIEKDERRASILVSNLDGSDLKLFAKGLRNTVFFTFDNTGRMWGNDMGRDFLGDNLPPDEVNIIEEGKDYGWPWCYGGRVRDKEFRMSENKDYCLNTQSAHFGYPAHIAPLGITFINSPLFSKEDQGDILTSFHGSWNSSVPVGYKVVKLDVEDGKIKGMKDFITGWLKGKDVIGRPVDLVFDKNGVLHISDDKADLVYILTK